jgi:hypothetical protein
MFTVVVMPLTEYLLGDSDDPAESAEVLQTLQETLSAEVGHVVEWAETPTAAEEYDVDELDEYSLWGLRVAAAHLELKGHLDGCVPGAAPWDHEIIHAMEEKSGSKQFPQLLHGDAGLAAYVPAELPDVYFVTLGDAEAPPEEEDDDESADELALGSLPALEAELAALQEPLGMPKDPDDLPDGHVFDADQDPLAPAKYAWIVLADRIRQARTSKTPMLISWEESFSDEHEHEHEHDKDGAEEPK